MRIGMEKLQEENEPGEVNVKQWIHGGVMTIYSGIVSTQTIYSEACKF